jgi:hypothetical protein
VQCLIQKNLRASKLSNPLSINIRQEGLVLRLTREAMNLKTFFKSVQKWGWSNVKKDTIPNRWSCTLKSTTSYNWQMTAE